MAKRKTKEGFVISSKMNKTVVVAVSRTMVHPRYGKVIKVLKKYKAHDENNDCKVGDRVILIESKPISREKRWKVQKSDSR